MAVFDSILYLDDMRVPKLIGVDLVRNFDEFVQYLEAEGVPDLISFDHDLAREHYPDGPNKAGQKIPYATYREKTGLDCARFLIENNLPLKNWAVHSQNVQGKINIERELRRYCRRGEVRDIYIPFDVRQQDEPVLPSKPYFSPTSLLQFEDEIALEGWERGLSESLVRR